MSLRFVFVESTSGNMSSVNKATESGAVDLRVEFGSLERASSISAFLETASTYSGASTLGLFLDDAGILSFNTPDPLAQSRSIPLQWTLTDEEGRLGARNLTIGSATMDRNYTLTGNALVVLFFQVEIPTSVTRGNTFVAGAGGAITLKYEVELLLDGRVLSSNQGTFAGPITHSVTTMPWNATLYAMSGLPTAGIELDKDDRATLQLRLFGKSDPTLYRQTLVYGGHVDSFDSNRQPMAIYTPSGLQMPAVVRQS